MNTKICSKCDIEKDLEEFPIEKGKYRNCCKECRNKYLKEYHLKNKEKANKISREYYKKHKEKMNKQSKEYQQNNKESIKLKRTIYNNINKEKIKKRKKEYYENNKERILKKDKEYYLENKERIIERNNLYFDKNKQKLIKIKNERQKEKRKNDNIYRLKCQSREMLKDSFKRKTKKKNKHTEEILGCSIDYFVNYLLQTYKNNYGVEWNKKEKIHIDHVIPLKNANTEEDVIRLCHYSNLQLLKAKDNLCKSSKLDWRLKNDN